jgi:redox-regulated HSP33 family molecular chaperone
MRRAVLLLTVMAACLVMASGVALAQEAPGGGDVCVSIKGDTKVDKGASECSSDETSKAVAVKDSSAFAEDDSKARATNNSSALAFFGCTATAQNGELVGCQE